MNESFIGKSYVFLLFVSLVACGNPSEKRTSERRDAAVADSFASGNEMLRTYEGLLPAADGPGIRYRLTLSGEAYGGSGSYEMTMTYLEAEDGEDRSFRSEGLWKTFRGPVGGSDAVVLQLDPEDSTARVDFLYMTDSLEMLGDGRTRIGSPLDYTLRLVGSGHP